MPDRATMRDLKVILINPPLPEEGYSKELIAPPLGPAYLAAVLENNEINVDRIIDCPPLGIRLKGLKGMLESELPDVVGISCTTLTLGHAHRVAKLAKSVLPHSLVVIGGPHVTFDDVETLRNDNAIDVVVRGEGEYTFLELVRRWGRGEDMGPVRGITYRVGDEIVRNPDMPTIGDLDELPFPAWHKLPPIDRYKAFGVKHRSYSILTSRGCPFNCKFCAIWKIYKRTYNERSAENVLSEIEFMTQEYGARRFSFVDDIFTLNRKRVERICDLIKDRGLDLGWYCETRVDMVSRQILQKMKDVGCRSIYFGVESGDQGILNSMRKGITVDQIKRAFQLCREVKIRTVASIMLFYPGETRETLKKTARLVEEIDPDLLHVNISTPFIGTDFYEEMAEENRLVVRDWTKYDILSPVLRLPEFTMSEMRSIWRRIYASFYLRPRYILRQLRRRNFGVSKAIFRLILERLNSGLHRIPFYGKLQKSEMISIE